MPPFRRPLSLVALSVAVLATAAAAQEDSPLPPAALIGYPTEMEPGVREALEAAVERFLAGDPTAAAEKLAQATAARDDLPPKDTLLAKLHLAVGRGDAARPALEKAVAAEPSDPEAFVILGSLALEDQRIAEATLLFAQAVRGAGRLAGPPARKAALLARAYDGQSQAALLRGADSQAESIVREWINIAPTAPLPQGRLGEALFRQGKLEDAYAALAERQKLAAQLGQPALRPELALAQLTIAGLPEDRAAYEQGVSQAKQLIATALRRDGESVETRSTAAQLLLEVGAAKEAAASAERALELAGDAADENLLAVAGLAHLAAGDFDVARDRLTAAHLSRPDNPYVIDQLAYALSMSDDARDRRRGEAFARLLTILAGDAGTSSGRGAVILLGWTQHRQGRLADAERTIRSVVQGTLPSRGAVLAARFYAETERPLVAKQLAQPLLRSPRWFLFRDQAERIVGN